MSQLNEKSRIGTKLSQKTIVIIGGGHGIGEALARSYSQHSENQIYVTYRNSAKLSSWYQSSPENIELVELDPLDEKALLGLSESLSGTELNVLINCVGILESDYGPPEKSLRSINLSQMKHVFEVNSLVTPLLAKVFQRKFSLDSKFVSLSAKLGSITDNQMGGWHSYRASKAALNMFVKTIAIEYRRSRVSCCVLAIHPGTTATELSKNYISSVNLKIHTAEQTANNIISVIEGTGLEDTGKFYSWNGEELPW